MTPITIDDIDREEDYVLMYQCTKGEGKVMHFFEMDKGNIIQWCVMGNTHRNFREYKVRTFEYYLTERKTFNLSDRRNESIGTMMDKPNAELFRITQADLMLHCMSHAI